MSEYYKIRPKSGTASQWATANTVLGVREIGFEVPTGGVGKGLVKMKMGDGVTPWNKLPYAIVDGLSVTAIVQNLDTDATDKVPSVSAVKNKINTVMGGCYISFTDAEGNPTTEPYIHWDEEVSS